MRKTKRKGRMKGRMKGKQRKAEWRKSKGRPNEERWRKGKDCQERRERESGFVGVMVDRKIEYYL
jgi:hypothetical protein